MYVKTGSDVLFISHTGPWMKFCTPVFFPLKYYEHNNMMHFPFPTHCFYIICNLMHKNSSSCWFPHKLSIIPSLRLTMTLKYVCLLCRWRTKQQPQSLNTVEVVIILRKVAHLQWWGNACFMIAGKQSHRDHKWPITWSQENKTAVMITRSSFPAFRSWLDLAWA